METLGRELHRVWDRKWNSEQFIVLQTVILQQAQHVTASHTIQWRIGMRLDAWGSAHHGMLVEESLRMCAQYLTAACR